MLSPLLFAILFDVVTKNARNDLILTNETIEDLQEKFLKWKVAFERNEN